MTYCKHFFGRTLKDDNGIPYGYQMGCLAGGVITDCGAHCKLFEPIPSNNYTTTNDNERKNPRRD